MKLLKVAIILSICFLFQACPGDDLPDPGLSILMVNNSNVDIVNVSYTSQDSLSQDPLLDRSEILEAKTVFGNSEKIYSGRSSTIKEFGFKIAFISRELIETTPWEEIRENNMVLKVYDLTFEEFEALDFTLEYP